MTDVILIKASISFAAPPDVQLFYFKNHDDKFQKGFSIFEFYFLELRQDNSSVL
jgi:hypothetical protein